MLVIEFLNQCTYLQATNVPPLPNQPIQQPAPAGNQVAFNAIVPPAPNTVPPLAPAPTTPDELPVRIIPTVEQDEPWVMVYSPIC
jgi:hypothetical protein